MENHTYNLPRAPLAHAREGKLIPKSIRTRINRLAHVQAQRYAQIVRDDALAELQAMLDAGATFDAVSAAVSAMETP